MNKFLNWLLLSSKNADEWSLTIKGATVMIPTIIIFANLAHVQVSSELLTQLIDSLANIVLYVGGAISGLFTAYGLLRKVLFSILGKNQTASLSN